MMTLVARRPAPVEPLAEREVHVWSALLDQPHGMVDSLRTLLSPDEIDRSSRFRFERDRSRFTVGRAFLRLLLARYLREPGKSIRISYAPNGKPMLSEARHRLSFNLSHSGRLALYAVCADAELGIDVEEVQPEPKERVPEQFFSPKEVATLRALPTAAQPAAFLTCWTRKEAFVKARGDGLSLPLDAFDVTLAIDELPAVSRTAWDPDEAASWSLHDLSASVPGYVASLAVRGTGWSVRVRPWSVFA